MYIKEVERLHNIGVYTNEMYNKIMSDMSDCGTGQLVGVVPNKANLIYNLKFNPENYNLIELVINSTPWLGADYDYPELFGKYGYTFTGIGDGFRWFRKDPNTKLTYKQIALNNTAIAHGYKAIDDATELELWKMLALSERYFGRFYSECYNIERKKKEPVRDFTIDRIVDKTEKYIVVIDTEGRMHGINLNGHEIKMNKPKSCFTCPALKIDNEVPSCRWDGIIDQVEHYDPNWAYDIKQYKSKIPVWCPIKEMNDEIFTELSVFMKTCDKCDYFNIKDQIYEKTNDKIISGCICDKRFY